MNWQPHADGFIKGHIGVFPSFGGAWVVWDDLTGEWNESKPLTFAASSGRTYKSDRNPPYEFWERSREETIEEAKRLADQWLERNETKPGNPVQCC